VRSFRSRIDLAIRSNPLPDAGDSVASVTPNHECVRPVRLEVSSRQADDRLLRLQFAIILVHKRKANLRRQKKGT
jgi:hypothetical protein